MDNRIALRENQNNNFDSQQSSLKNQFNSSLSEGDGEETTKENFNPKSLSEIAADQTKLTPFVSNNTTSTPKTVRKEQLSSDFDLDYSIDIQPNYPRAPFQSNTTDISLSFLTEGLNKLGLGGSETPIDVRSNATFSDDEENFVECQSFHDSSSRFASVSTASRESINTLEVNRTIDINVGDGNETLKFDNTVEGGNQTFDADIQKLNETKTVSSPSNQTIEKVEQEIQQNIHKMGESFIISSQPKASSTEPSSTEPKEIMTPEVSRSSIIEVEKVLSPSSQEFIPSQEVSPLQDLTPSIVESEKIASVQEFSPSQDQNVSITEMMDISIAETKEVETSVKENLPITVSLEHLSPLQQIEQPEAQELPDISSKPEVIATEEKNISPTEIVTPDEVGVPQSELEVSYHNIDEISFEKLPVKENLEAEKPQQSSPTVTAEAIKSPSPSKKAENVFVEKMESSIEVQFKMPAAPVFKQSDVPSDEEFKTCGSSYNFNESDFDYLQNAGSDKQRWTLQRDSILCRFDPLLAQNNDKRLTITQEEDDYVADFELKLPAQDVSQSDSREFASSADNTFGSPASVIERSSREVLPKEDDMNCVDIMKDISVENKISESNHIEGEETKLSSHRNEENGLKMAELENKVKKEAEMREETLLKRISEKDKQIAKMNGVVEAYEKAISELIAEKEQLVQSYEKKCLDLKSDSESNANHLASLEATFSDLHAKYERTKQVAMEFKDREEGILQDRKTLTDSLKMQEARYDKMKAHAMSQLEIANSTLAEINRNHQAEVTKLKALLKKEEISRASVNEQLIQKAKENSELVKICDELINGTQSS